MKIIIVESPSKSKAIESYMGNEYKVLASYGHIRDLSISGKDNLGVDISKGFIPNYVIIKGKESIVSDLRKACKGREVYLATDPDREGEAISWHLANILHLDPKLAKRVVFNEITAKAVRDAFAKPRHIDTDLVSSQETRRILDRIIGFKLSKLLQLRIKSKSAGRVQSTVLKVICDLEKEITSFVSTPYFYINGILPEFKLDLVNDKKEKMKFEDRNEALDVLGKLHKEFKVSDILHKQQSSESRMPLITSTLQQTASVRHGFSPDRTLRVAQSLYEGKDLGSEHVGLITYMRTDSTRLSSDFAINAMNYIEQEFGVEYKGRVKYKNKQNSQDAHEAIRPTDITRTPESVRKFLSNDEFRVYRLIYESTLASLMAPAIFMNTTVLFENGNYTFKLMGKKLLFDGHLRKSGITDEDKNKEIPEFRIGDVYTDASVQLEELFTKPKTRFSEATLIKEMEDLGIGRPSTYAQTIKTLIERKYIIISEKRISPTDQGVLTIERLDEFFAEIVSPKYTASMESTLDDIATGAACSVVELQKFYDEFSPLYATAYQEMTPQKAIPTGDDCPKCGKPMVLRNGRFGEFISCSDYPKCKYIFKEKKDEEDTGITCPECRKGSILRRLATKGRSKGNYFYSCNRFPKCKTTYEHLPTDTFCPVCGDVMFAMPEGPKCLNSNCGKPQDPSAVKCPLCGDGVLMERVATRGKNKGNKFYSCSKYPKCKALYNHLPTGEKCPVCGELVVTDGENSSCANKNCENYIKLHD